MALLLGLILLNCVPARANEIVIATPDTLYLNGTAKIPVTAAQLSTMSSISDGTETLSFDPAPFATTFARWGFLGVESPTPGEVVQSFSQASTGITLSLPQLTFGLEIANAESHSLDVTVLFEQGTSVLATISRTLDSRGGAQLFALTGTIPIDNVIISVDGPTVGYGMGEFRYGEVLTTVPEQSSFFLLGAGSIVLALLLRRRTARAAAR
ncbi:MAG TPA: hypothetical protein VG675_03295 [Bryobacteraceae bacterium]|nr:hypothetical protein [Bryobacteraceae bacterium]